MDHPHHFADRLSQAIRTKGAPVCVGLDPRWDRLPASLRKGADTEAQRVEAVGRFCREVLRAVAPHVPAVKPQSAYFEALGPAGVQLYYRLTEEARQHGLLVIGDAKRNDIGSTAEAYATAHLARPDSPDAVTVNGYFGTDGLLPFCEQAEQYGKGLFVLVRTSNPSAGEVQDIPDAGGTPLYRKMAEMVARIGERFMGAAGLSSVGAVVGATWPDEARQLREVMGQQIFLVPGYGAQGATADDCKASFRADGTGAIVNASRSVIYAFDDAQGASDAWPEAIAAAAQAFAADLAGALGATSR